MALYELTELAKALANEFDRRHMGFHLESLRRFCTKIEELQSGHDGWSEQMMTEWLALFGVQPFAKRYPLRSAGSSCWACRTKVVRVNVVTVFPGGSKRSCVHCGTEWVEKAAG